MKNDVLKRVLSLFMALVLLFEMVPATALPVSAADNLCVHHTHSGDSCSYREEVVCTHTHDAGCYARSCVHSCDGSCGYREEIPGEDCDCGAEDGGEHTEECSFREAVPGSDCRHVCSVDSGCVSDTPSCSHTDDGSCCYAAPQDCDFVCQECLNPMNMDDEEDQKNPDEEDQKNPDEEEQKNPDGEEQKNPDGEEQKNPDGEEQKNPDEEDKKQEEGSDPVCICGEGEKCSADLVKEGCEVCGKNIADCAGTEKEEKPAECTCEYQCQSAEDGALCPVCGAQDGWTGCTKEPKPQAEQVDGVFGISWSNRSHSGKVPDLSGDIQVLDANGSLVDSAIARSEGGYSVSGLSTDNAYTLVLTPAADAVYSVSGSLVMELAYDSDKGSFVGGNFAASLNTYTLQYNIVWPEGMTAPEGFAPEIRLGDDAVSVPQTRTENGFLVSDLYEVDGEYTIQLPKVEGMSAKRYAVPFTHTTKQPLEIAYGLGALSAEFVVYWNDGKDATGRRTMEEMEDMLRVRTDDGQVLEGLTIVGEKQKRSELEDYEKYIYSIEDITGYTGTGLTLEWESDALMGYSALFTADGVNLTEGFAPLRLTRGQTETCFDSKLAYALVLPQYNVQLEVVGLDTYANSCLQDLLDSIVITRMDLITGEEYPFTDYTVTQDGDILTFEGLFTNTLEEFDEEYEVMPAYYTMTWPEQIGAFRLSEDSDKSLTVFAQMVELYDIEDSADFTAKLIPGQPNYDPQVDDGATSKTDVVWYDTTNTYPHPGALGLKTTLTINDHTVILSTNADEEAGELALVKDETASTNEGGLYKDVYTYSFADWTAAEFCSKFGITLNDPETEGHPTAEDIDYWLDRLKVTVTNDGENNLNRVVTAESLSALRVDREQFTIHEPDYIEHAVTLGNPEVFSVNASSSDVVKYVIGSIQKNGKPCTVLYPIVKVRFTVQMLTGDDDPRGAEWDVAGATPTINDFLKIVEDLRIHYKKNGVVEHQILQQEGNQPSKLEQLLQLEAGALGPVDDFYMATDGGLNEQTGTGVYTFMLPLYDATKQDIEYCMSIQNEGDDINKKVVTIDGRDYYFRVEYDNTAASGHGTDTDQAYQEGKVVLIRTGETDFKFNKYWRDGYDTARTEEEKAAILAARPQATYELWRYSDKTVKDENGNILEKGSYKTSANVVITSDGSPVTMPTNGQNPIQLTLPANLKLDKYDNEGYPYVYFVREHMPSGSGYQMKYGIADEDGNVEAGSDVLPDNYINGDTRASQDTGVYYNGNLTNIKTDSIAPSVTKTWVGAYYQDHFNKLRVEMKLYRRLENQTDAQATLVDTFVMDDFDAYNPTESIQAPRQPLYDEAGNKYVYWWEEASVQEGTTGADNAFTATSYPATPAALTGMATGQAINAAAPVINPSAVQTAEEDGEDDVEEDTNRKGETKTYYLPMNAQTVIADSYSPDSKEYFEVTSYVDANGVTHFTNTLKGTTEYWVRKTWDTTLTPGTVTFSLLQIDAASNSVQWDNNNDADPNNNTCSLPTSAYAGGYPTDRADTTYDSGWHKGYVDLPKYDDDGNRYTYIAREGTVENAEPISVYGKDVHEGPGVGYDGAKEAQSIHVHNAKIGRDTINVRKLWLDDSAYTDRTNVQFQITAAVQKEGTNVMDTVLLYGKTADGAEGLYDGYVTLEQAKEWIETVDVTLYVDAAGNYHTHQIGESSPQIPALLAEGDDAGQVDPQPQQYQKVTPHHYTVTEVSLNDGKSPVSLTEKTAAGYSTVKYQSTTYAVIYQHKAGNNMVINPTGTTAKDKDDYYTVTNLRIGTTKLGITKIWNDDGTVIRTQYNARVTVQCDTSGRLENKENDKGYAKVHEAVYTGGWMPVMGGTVETPTAEQKTHVNLTQKIPDAIEVFSEEDGQDEGGNTAQTHHTSFVYYYDLPLYDENGKILQYTVEEATDKVGNIGYNQVSSPLVYEQSTASQYFGVQTIENTYTDTTPVQFHLLWLDDYREEISQRPDMYLTLYYAEYEYEKDAAGNLVMEDGIPKVKTDNGNPVYTLKPYDYKEYSWRDATQETEDFWTYTFNDLRNYDAYGRKISYYATVSSLTDMPNFDYLLPQYALGEVPTNAIFQSGVSRSDVDPETLEIDHEDRYTYDGELNGLPHEFPIRRGEGTVVLQSDNTFVLQLSSRAYVQGHKVWENVPVGFEESDLPLLNFVLKRELTEEEMKPTSLSPFHATVDDEDGKSRINLAVILNYRSPSQDYTFDMYYMGLLTQNTDGEFKVLPKTATIGGKTALQIWMEYTGIQSATVADSLYGLPLPKYDSYGTMYKYKVIDTIVQTDNEGFQNNGVIVDLETTINEYKIVNTIRSAEGAVNVTKNWYRFDNAHPFAGDANSVYPDMEFRLYRFVRIDNENFTDSTTNPGSDEEQKKKPEYTNLELVNTLTISGADVKAKIAAGDPYVAFTDLEIYAPNGNPFIYFVAEKQIPGFNTTAGDPAVAVSNADAVTLDKNVLNHPNLSAIEGYWLSGYFRLKAASVNTATPDDNTGDSTGAGDSTGTGDSTSGNTSGNTGDSTGGNTGDGTETAQPENAAEAVFGNVYTAKQQTEVPFSKEWEDSGNKFNTRPDSLSVILYRSLSNGTRKEPIGTFTICNTPKAEGEYKGKVTVVWEDGFAPTDPLVTDTNIAEDATVYKNLTSTDADSRIRVKNTDATVPAPTGTNGNFWTMTVEHLDMHGPDGKPYKYSWGEAQVPAGYTSTVTANGLKNTLSTSLNVFKKWSSNINAGISKPVVKVRLMVTNSLEAPVTWYPAATFANGELANKLAKNGQPYAFEQELDAPYWYAHYAGLPTGLNQLPLYYTVEEIEIGGKPITNGSAGWTVTVTDSADQRVPSKDVTNTPTTTRLTVTKVWEDDSNAYENRYLNGDQKWEVSYHIYRKVDGGQPERLKASFTGERPAVEEDFVLTVTGTNKTANTASNYVDGLPTHDPTGKLYTYYAVELNPNRDGNTSAGTEVQDGVYDEGYSTVHTNGTDNNGFTTSVTNSLDRVNLEVTKQWLDDAGFPNVRPGDEAAESFDWNRLTLTLHQYGGEYGTEGREITTHFEETAAFDNKDVFKWTVVEDADGQWKIVYIGLPKTGSNGQPYTYKVEEAQVDGYQPAVPDDDTGVAENGNQTFRVSNRITKFTIEKLGKNNASSTETQPLRDVKLVFTGDETATAAYTLEWISQKTDSGYKETYHIYKNGADWSSGEAENASVPIYGLPEGLYKLTSESVLPKGYYPVAVNVGAQFRLTTVDEVQTLAPVNAQGTLNAVAAGENTLPQLEVYNYKTTLLINKQGKTINATSGAVVDNNQNTNLNNNDQWEFKITGTFADNTTEKFYTTADRNATKLRIGDLVVGNTYVLTETKTPDGYTLSKTQIEFTINEQNKVVIGGNVSDSLTFKNEPFRVIVQKNPTGNTNTGLSGAQFKLFVLDETDKTMSEVTLSGGITTDSNGKKVISSYLTTPKLKADNATKYLLVETKAPNGYILEDVAGPEGYTIADSIRSENNSSLTHPWIMFHFDTDGNLQKDLASNVQASVSVSGATVTNSGNTAKFTDDPIELYLEKHDNGDILEKGPIDLDGITFELWNSAKTTKLGTVTTKNGGHIDFADLKLNNKQVLLVGGTVYYLREVACNGYYQVGDIKFKLRTNGSVDILESGKYTVKGVEVDNDFVTSTKPDDRDDTTFKLGNERKPGSVILTKGSPLGDLSGVNFKLYWEKPNTSFKDWVTGLVTGKKYELVWSETGEGVDKQIKASSGTGTDGTIGKLEIGNLPWGNYKLVEEAPRDGFLLPQTNEVTFSIGRSTENMTVYVTLAEREMYNSDFKVTITKKDASISSNGTVTMGTNFLNGAKFELWEQYGEGQWTNTGRVYTSEKVGNDNGVVTVPSVIMEDGEITPILIASDPASGVEKHYYRLVEIEAPAGYELLTPENPVFPEDYVFVDFWVDQQGNITYSKFGNKASFVSGSVVGNLPIEVILHKFDKGDEYTGEDDYEGTVTFSIKEKGATQSTDLTMTGGELHIGVKYNNFTLVSGKTYVIEETPVQGYEALGGTIEFYVNADGTIDLLSNTSGVTMMGTNEEDIKIVNTRKKGKIILEKKGAFGDSTFNLNGAVFELSRADDTENWLQKAWDFITGNTYKLVWTNDPETGISVDKQITSSLDDGKLVIEGLPWGVYQLKEIAPPDGFRLKGNLVHEFVINAQTVEEDTKIPVDYEAVYNDTFEFKFYKHATNNLGEILLSKPLAGAVFKLTDAAGNELKTYTSGSDGSITVKSAEAVTSQQTGKAELKTYLEVTPAGTAPILYRITEVQAPKGYELPADAPYVEFWVERPVSNDDTQDNNSDAALFRYSSSNSSVYTHANNYYFLDKPIRIQLSKRDFDDAFNSNEALAGVTFRILAENGTALAGIATGADLVTTGEDGKVWLPMITTTAGEVVFPVANTTYRLRETTPSGYHAVKDILFTVNSTGVLTNVHFDGTVAKGSVSNSTITVGEETGVEQIQVTNHRVRGEVKLTKIGADETVKLNNAVFDLYKTGETTPWITGFRTGYDYVISFEDGAVSATGTEDTPGELYITGLPWDAYYLLEVKAPDGYKLPEVGSGANPRVHEFTINETTAETIQLNYNVQNTKFTVDFWKHASANGTTADAATLAGAKFTLVRKSDNQLINTYISDGDGKITLDSIGQDIYLQVTEKKNESDPIVYVLTEIEAPKGYELPADAPTVEFWFDETGEIRFVDGSRNHVVGDKFLDKPIRVRLSKRDFGDEFESEDALAGVTFQILDANGNAFAGIATDADLVTTVAGGYVWLPMIEATVGEETTVVFPVANTTYRLRETTPSGYHAVKDILFTVDPTGVLTNVHFDGEVAKGSVSNSTVTVDGETGVEQIQVTNHRIYGTVTLRKYTLVDGMNFDLNDAHFTLSREDDAEGWLDKLLEFVTGKTYTLVWTSDEEGNVTSVNNPIKSEPMDGKLVISNLPWGTYVLTETKAPNGLILENQTYEFTIGPENTEEEITLNAEGDIQNNSFTFSFSKHATADGKAAGEELAGAKYKLEVSEDGGTTWTPVETNQSLDSGDGSTITLNSVEKVEVPAEEEGAEPTYLFRPVLIASTAEKTYIYRITEIQAPLGYELPKNAQNMTPYLEVTYDITGAPQYVGGYSVVELTGDGAAYGFLDKSIEITLEKWDGGDEYDDANLMEGVEFEILNTDGESFAEPVFVVTGAEGKVQLPHIFETVEDRTVCVFPVAGNTYYLRETTVNGFRALNNISFKVEENGTVSNVAFVNAAEEDAETFGTATVTPDNAEGITVVNDRIYGTVTLRKYTLVDGMNFDLNDAHFTLSREDDAEGWLDKLLEFVTGKTYTLVWTSDEEGNVASVNNPIKSEPMDGKLVISNLPWGTYVLTETKAPNGLILENQTYEFTIGPENTEEEITLNAEGDIQNNSFTFSFSKHATADGKAAGEALAGAEYKLEVSEDGGATWTPVETNQSLISGEDDTVTLSSVEVVEDADAQSLRRVLTVSNDESTYLYRITETKAPAGYELPDETPYVEFWFDTTGKAHYEDSKDVTDQFQFLDKPIELVLVKYDGGDRCTDARYTFADPDSFTDFDKLAKLDGITFTLTDLDGNVQRATTDDGIITFGQKQTDDFRVVGGQTYVLAEEDAEKFGYTEIEPVTFTVLENGTIVLAEDTTGAVTVDEADTTLRAVNDRILGTVTLTKRDDGAEKLDGVVFNLYREEVPAGLLDKLMEFITGKTYILEDSFVWGEDATEQITEEDGTQVGVLTIRNLDWGCYKLVEVFADGYVLGKDAASRTYTFEIGPDNAETGAALEVDLEVTNIPNRLTVQKVGEGDTKLLAGAQYDLYFIDKDGKETKITNTTDKLQPMWIWNSETGTGEAYRLNSGTYRLVETRSPYGYVIADPIEFTIDQQGNVKFIKGNGRVETNAATAVPVLVAEDMKTLFQFTKVELYNENCSENAEDTRILPGVTFTAYEDAALTKVIGTAVSDENGVVTFEGLPLKDYMGAGTSTPVYIRETATVPGHVLNTDVFMVYLESGLNAKGEVESRSVLVLDGEELADNTVVNDVYRADFSFTKVSELNNLRFIPGAEYGLYKTVKLGVGSIQVDYEYLVAKATSDAYGVVTFEGLLMDTEYTVRELSVPAGSYLSANDIKFSFKWNINEKKAELTILDDGDDTITEATAKDKIQGLLWQEPQVVVSILKVTSSKKPLDGATLQIRDRHGKVIPVLDINGKQVKSWVSTKEAHIVSGILEAGETYWLHELDAPSGFVRARAVKFTIPDKALEPGENFLVKVMMINHRVEEAPKTGDDIMIAGSVMTFSAAALVVLLMLKKKKR